MMSIQTHLKAELVAWAAMLQATAPQKLLLLALVMALSYALTCLVLKAVLFKVLRKLGLYSPELYHHLPSVIPLWRVFYRLWMLLGRWREVLFKFGRYPTAGFASAMAVMTMMYTPSKLLLGRVWCAGFGLTQPVGLKIERHIMAFAMTGSGKTTWLITMLSLWRGSACIIDPKGQITSVLQLNDKRQWIVFYPHELERSAQWNPLDDIKLAMTREGQNTGVKWAQRLAESLIVTPAGSKTPFFSDTARGYLTGLILHVLAEHPSDEHHLPFVYELVIHGYRLFNDDGSIETTPEEARLLLDQRLLQSTAFDGAVSASASAFINSTGDTKGSLVATLQEQLKWLALPSVKHMLLTTTLPLGQAKCRDDVVLSFVAPVLSLREELQPLFRAFCNFVSYTFEAVPDKKGQCLFIIDEVQAMGHNATLEVALPVARSYGLSIVAIAQDREGMKAAYPKTFGSFEGNADCVLFMATNHPDNYNHVSQSLGKRTDIQIDPRSGARSYRETDVMTPDQVKRFLSTETGNLIAIRAGGRALRLKIAPYFTELPVTSYVADPDHKEPILRRVSRLMFNPKSLNSNTQNQSHRSKP